MTKTEELDTRYANGEFIVLINSQRMVPVRDRAMVRIVNDRLEVRSGKRWTSCLGCQVKFARNA